MGKVIRDILSRLMVVCGLLLCQSSWAHAQSCNAPAPVEQNIIADLTERLAELLVTVDVCAATEEQLNELEDVRQEIRALTPETSVAECPSIDPRVAALEATLPRLSSPRQFEPEFLDQPVPRCGANREDRARSRAFSHLTRAFLNTRANLLLSSDPDRTRITRRFGGANSGGASNMTNMSLAQDPSRKQPAMTLGPSGYSASAPLSSNPKGLRVWSEGYLSWFDENLARDGDFQVLYAGGDVLLGPNVMIGVLGQVDWMDESSSRLGSKIDGQGWMVGPYFGVLLGPVWQFDARAAWGQSDNDINLLGGRGSFDTDRWLVRGSLRGNWYSGAWRLTSITELGYVEEQQERFRESGGAVIPGQTVSLGRFTFGPEFAYRMEANGFVIEPQVSLQGLWNFDQIGNVVLDGFVSSPDDFYGRIEGGLMLGRDGGMTFRAVGGYEGISASDFEMWSARVWASIPLN